MQSLDVVFTIMWNIVFFPCEESEENKIKVFSNTAHLCLGARPIEQIDA